MKFFVDFHHAELASGILRLLCCRLGHSVYFPGLGADGKCGFYHYETEGAKLLQWGNCCTEDWLERVLSKKFLVDDPGYENWIESYKKIPTHPIHQIDLEEYKKHHISAGWGAEPEEKEIDAHSVSWEEFQDIDFNCFILTCTHNADSFRELRKLKPNAACIVQSGNQEFDYPYDEFPNLMSSSVGTYERAPDNINKCYYWQEFDMDFRFSPTGPPQPEHHNTIRTFQHYIQSLRWSESWRLFKQNNPEYTLISHGASNDLDLPDLGWDQPFAIRDSAASVYIKEGSEGYGFGLLHNLVMGRPVIGHFNECRGQTREKWLKPDVSMINIDNPYDYPEFERTIKNYCSDSQKMEDMYESTVEYVRPQFDWGREADTIRNFLDNLK